MASTEPATQSNMGNLEEAAKELQDSIMMPPPPPPPNAKVILEPEMNGLLDALKNAVGQTASVYKFHNATSRHQVTSVQPPQSVVAALGREVERYDQICDSLEAYVLRALAVLQRDLAKEEKKIEEQRLAQKAKEEAERKSEREQNLASSPEAMKNSEVTAPPAPTSSPMSTSSHPGRRPSAISISSLHRPSLPGKLDLSSASFRLSSSDDSSIFNSGLASPVTLAPKSARPLGPNEIPGDFINPFGGNDNPVDMDLSIPNVMSDSSQPDVDLAVGDSSDKPIELDLENMDMDMADLFGEDPDSADPTQETMGTSEDIFAQAVAAGFDAQGDSILSSLGAAGDPSSTAGQEGFNFDNLLDANFFPDGQEQGMGDDLGMGFMMHDASLPQTEGNTSKEQSS